MDVTKRIKQLINDGIYDQNVIFGMLYPTYLGHYSRLRETIAKVKNG